MVFASMSLRLRVDVEAANMIESIGNYTRHRIVPIINRVYNEDGSIEYELAYLAGISGQAINNAYMRALVDVSGKYGLPICDMCRNYELIGGFPKRPNILGEDDNVDKRVRECVVEDVTGFMATKERRGGESGQGIRRTSAVMFSYMVPDTDTVRHSPPIPQFHIRYGREGEQAIFNVEASSGIYRLLIAIDVDKIGKLTNGEPVGDREKRIRAAFDALALMFQGYLFAKKARYLPQVEFLGGIAVVTDPYRFMASPARARPVDGRLVPWYIMDTLERARKFRDSVGGLRALEVYYFDNEFNYEARGDGIPVRRVGGFEELVAAVRDAVLRLV